MHDKLIKSRTFMSNSLHRRYNIDENKLVKHTKDDLDIVLGVLNISSTDNSTDKNR